MARKSKKKVPTGKLPSALALLFAVCVLVLVFGRPILSSARVVYEDVNLMLSPSVEKTYEYGVRHFDAIHASEYDRDRAEELFDRVYAMDPEHPFIQHQRARIAFLKGDLLVARMRADDAVARGTTPSSLYLRGLINGYLGDYSEAARDYEMYLRGDSSNWAALTDYSWVLIKDGRPYDALVSIDWGLMSWPDNPWLLNMRAATLFEIGRYEEARTAAYSARDAVVKVSEADWSAAYPGNDPRIASTGIVTLSETIETNIHRIEVATENAKNTMQ